MSSDYTPPEHWQHAARLALEHGPRAAPVAAAIRAAQARALDIAAEADMDGRPGIARALRRKVAQPRTGDVQVQHLSDRVRASITAHGIAATATRHSTVPPPAL